MIGQLRIDPADLRQHDHHRAVPQCWRWSLVAGQKVVPTSWQATESVGRWFESSRPHEPVTAGHRPFSERSKEARAVPKIGLGHQQVTIPTALCLRDKGPLPVRGLSAMLACRSRQVSEGP
jgi:hypothetical protein